MSKREEKNHVVIMGGGLAGLAAAHELSKNNLQVTIIEMQEDIGGLARTIEKDKFRFDTGPHRWYTKNDTVNNWMLNLLKDEIIKVPRLTRIYFDNKFFYYPIQFKNVVFGIGLFNAARAVTDYLLVRIVSQIRSKKAITLEDGYIEKFGYTLYKTFFKRYSEKLWGRSCQEVSSDWIGQRTRGFNIGTILKDMLFKSKKIVSFVDEFSYPKKGIGRIAEKLAEKIKVYNGKVITNARITKINHKNKKISSVEYIQKNKKQTLYADYFISTIPMSDAVFALQSNTPREIVGLAKRLIYREQIEVVLFINKSHVVPDTWVYVHPEEISFLRFMEMDNWSKNLAPKGKTSIVFEISCSKSDKMWNMNNEQLIKRVTNEFIREFRLITEDNIVGAYVHRIEKAYPIYHIGYRNDVGKIKKYLQTFDNFQIAGRNGTFRYNNMDHSIEMGLFSAWNLIKGKNKYNIDSVNIEKEYLEEKN